MPASVERKLKFQSDDGIITESRSSSKRPLGTGYVAAVAVHCVQRPANHVVDRCCSQSHSLWKGRSITHLFCKLIGRVNRYSSEYFDIMSCSSSFLHQRSKLAQQYANSKQVVRPCTSLLPIFSAHLQTRSPPSSAPPTICAILANYTLSLYSIDGPPHTHLHKG